ncbi:hypothetical protein K5E_14260 [Enterococcus thailandicus]|uniref:Uncharacterized protein n=2 Tax=Enterococcus TaxID=1350 RepID=A0A179ERR5_ENTTH|nr:MULTISPECIES: hypothetical protein [Enterococcus]ASZ08163.1 hypothetical protein CK496_09680 [Enterococcus thailandicus]MDK4352796.1 hypothetical protein [Enterococcus thailandicus]MDT2734850.1 hypothetical protein [Enterococcus thailandicus]MDT2795108.1 hypothetical protein [Enterococcus thailandicus]MEA4829457.1 hypothetical protein [Enterococcus thailandicus]
MYKPIVMNKQDKALKKVARMQLLELLNENPEWYHSQKVAPKKIKQLATLLVENQKITNRVPKKETVINPRYFLLLHFLGFTNKEVQEILFPTKQSYLLWKEDYGYDKLKSTAIVKKKQLLIQTLADQWHVYELAEHSVQTVNDFWREQKALVEAGHKAVDGLSVQEINEILGFYEVLDGITDFSRIQKQLVLEKKNRFV